MSDQTTCPSGPFAQSSLNLSSKDKFLMVLNLPSALRKRSLTDPTLNIKKLEMSIFGTTIPQVSVPPVDTRILGQSVKFTSLNRPEYAPLNINFIVDNQFQNYYLLWRWLTIYNDPKMSGYTGPDDPESTPETEYQTTFSILGLNEYNSPAIEFQFHNAFLTGLGPITYDYKGSEQIECTAEFTFNQLIINPSR